VRENFTAWARFVAWITAQGSSLAQLENPELLPHAPLVETLPAPRGGFIVTIDPAEVGKTAVDLGGGRAQKGDVIDYGVGVRLHAKVGAHVAAGEPLVTIHANDSASLAAARMRLLAAFTRNDIAVTVPPHTLEIIE
jgi:pyrimidine-nucleoside phosphorylase